MNKRTRIYVAGHTGMIGSAIVRLLEAEGYMVCLPSQRVDLRDSAATYDMFYAMRPHVVFFAAGTVGGIDENMRRPADFIRDNILMQTNVISACTRVSASRLMFLGSSCAYPRDARQPMRETDLFDGPPEPTNAAYAEAKRAGVVMLDAYRSQYGLDSCAMMVANVYGPGDRSSHVIPSLMRRMHEAKLRGDTEVAAWGTGLTRREFIYVDDVARAALHLAQQLAPPSLVNVGTCVDRTIGSLALEIADVVGYRGVIAFDRAKPDGAPRKLLDSRRIRETGWRPGVDVFTGLRETYASMRG